MINPFEEMSKLQLYITKSLRGFKSLVNFNPSEDVARYVTDVRDALEVVEYDPAEKNIFYLLRYQAEGVMVVVLRTIPDKPLDHLAAWIFVPAGLEISSDELEEVVRVTTRKVSNPGVSEADVMELRQLFAKEYPVDREAGAIVAMHGKEYAFAQYGGEGHDLADYLGERMFQPSFLGYRGVVLLDGDLGLCGKGIDLSGEELAPIVKILPPENPDNGFAPFIYGQPFDKPYRAALGSDLAISWRRGGFDAQEQIITVTADGQQPGAIETDGAKKTITASSFLITSQSSKEVINDCSIKVNGTLISGAHTFTQAELTQAYVWISADGYFPYSGRMDLASTNQALVQMQERGKVYRLDRKSVV